MRKKDLRCYTVRRFAGLLLFEILWAVQEKSGINFDYERQKNKRTIQTIDQVKFCRCYAYGFMLFYAVVWSEYYNETILQLPFYRRGNWMMVLIYGILLAFFLQTYGGFKIGYLKNGNLIYSQIISVLFTNIVTYLQIAVIDRRLVNPIYLLPMTLAEISFIVIWTMIFQVGYRNMFRQEKCFLLKGTEKIII